MLKAKQLFSLIGLFSAGLVRAAEPVNPAWILVTDFQYRASDKITHAGGVTGEFGRSRAGLELIHQTPEGAIDLEWYQYRHRFSGAVAGTDRSYGDATNLLVTGFREWAAGAAQAWQLIYGLEWAAEDAAGLSTGFRWGVGGAFRWQPDAETEVTLGLVLQDRFENSPLPIPYIKAVWRPCRFAEVELRTTGLQNGFVIRGFLTEDRATTVDLTVAYETLSFVLTDGSYGSRAVAIGEVPIRFGLTQFLEPTGTWFVRGSAEWTAFARHSFQHDGETQGSFEPGGSWGLAARVGARF